MMFYLTYDATITLKLLFLHKNIQDFAIFSKTCAKQPLQNRQNKGLNDKW